MRIVAICFIGFGLALTAADQAKGPAEEKSKTTVRENSKDGQAVSKRTPFGTARYEKKAEEKKKAEAPADMRAFEEGDLVRFERKTPFGVAKWTRKRNELDETEQAVLERERSRRQAKDPPKK